MKKKTVIKKPVKDPVRGSLAWLRAEWQRAFGEHVTNSPPEGVLSALAQLSYENKQLRKRLEALEALQLAQIFGQVFIGGTPHLMDCGKREAPERPCTCGSLPPEEEAAHKKRRRRNKGDGTS